MGDAVRKRRIYRSPHRLEQAKETRERLLAAARRLFVERGFAGTTIVSIAEAGGTAPETVYAIFRTKLAVLEALVESGPRQLNGASGPSRSPRDQRDQIGAIAEAAALGHEESGPLMAVIAGAAKSEPRLAALLETFQLDRRRAQRSFVDGLMASGALRIDREDAVDALWALASPELFGLLTEIRSWSRSRYKSWLADTLAAVLLAPR